MNMRLGRVAAVHPGDHSVDLVMIDDGSRLAGVQVMTGSGTSNSGSFDLPTPSTPASGDKWSLTEQTDRDMMAVVGMVGPRPVVTGFLFPQVSQMLFKDPNMKVSRHASDVYTALDGEGNFEMAFPNGTFLRIGSTPEHVDLSGKNVDGSWSASKNTGAALHIHLEQGGGTASMNVSPDGTILLKTNLSMTIETGTTVTVNATGDTTVNTRGRATVNATGDATVKSDSAVNVQAPAINLNGA